MSPQLDTKGGNENGAAIRVVNYDKGEKKEAERFTEECEEVNESDWVASDVTGNTGSNDDSSSPTDPPPPRAAGIVVSREDLLKFQRRRDSLRLSAHRLAALAGYHPYADLPRFLFDLVYQGPMGRALLRADADLLGVVLTSDEEVLAELAAKGGEDCVRALKEAAEVKSGRRAVGTATEAADMKTVAADVAAAAKRRGKLTEDEVRQLEEGVRSAIDTGFGTRHEDEALNKYEKVCGWEVRERNAEVREWKFALAEDREEGTCPDVVLVDNQSAPTVKPMGRASAKYRTKENEDLCEKKASPDVGTENAAKVSAENGPGEEKVPLSIPTARARNEEDQREAEPTDTVSGDESNKVTAAATGDAVQKKKEHRKRKRPFFSILGAVDGIRDEVYFDRNSRTSSAPVEPADEFDDGMALREIIVECKHRMKRVMDPPPLYDQIQAVAYCLMYETHAAEIVQVLRKKRRRVLGSHFKDGGVKAEDSKVSAETENNGKVEDSKDDGGAPRKDSRAILKYFGNCRKGALPSEGLPESYGCEKDCSTPVTKMLNLDSCDGGVDESQHAKLISAGEENNPGKPPPPCNGKSCAQHKREEESEAVSVPDPDSSIPSHQDTLAEYTNIEVTVSRVYLDDPCLPHRRNWNDIVLPRLRSFADAAYNVRANDELRYRLLVNLAGSKVADDGEGALGEEPNEQLAWRLLFELCPWIMDCDTAYNFRWGKPCLCN